jgi:hypothetical protein
MSELQILRSEIEAANALVVRLIGRNRIEHSRENARKLAERMHREKRRALIMDYRQCALDHTVSQFAEVAEIFATAFPPGLRVAYVYAPENFMHAALMTKRLAKNGFPARATADFDEAVAFVSEA